MKLGKHHLKYFILMLIALRFSVVSPKLVSVLGCVSNIECKKDKNDKKEHSDSECEEEELEQEKNIFCAEITMPVEISYKKSLTCDEINLYKYLNREFKTPPPEIKKS